MTPCYRHMSGNSAEQVFAGFFIRYFFELPGEIQVVPADDTVLDQPVAGFCVSARLQLVPIIQCLPLNDAICNCNCIALAMGAIRTRTMLF